MIQWRMLPMAMHVTTADKAGAEELLAFNFSTLLGMKKLIVDGGYSGANFADFVKIVYAAAKRWIVERSFGWLDTL